MSTPLAWLLGLLGVLLFIVPHEFLERGVRALWRTWKGKR
jgi:hypothetical protein